VCYVVTLPKHLTWNVVHTESAAGV